jgi:hypothetical protein
MAPVFPGLVGDGGAALFLAVAAEARQPDL